VKALVSIRDDNGSLILDKLRFIADKVNVAWPTVGFRPIAALTLCTLSSPARCRLLAADNEADGSNRVTSFAPNGRSAR
jgi:hypothetical protein